MKANKTVSLRRIEDELREAEKIRQVINRMLFHNTYSIRALEKIEARHDLNSKELNLVKRAVHLRNTIAHDNFDRIEAWIMSLEKKYVNKKKNNSL